MDITEFALFIYKILPIIMVSYFVISSFLGNEFSGFLIFIGILLSSFITIGVGNLSFVKNPLESMLGKQNNAKFSDIINKYKMIKDVTLSSMLPLGTHTFSFIFGYFLMVLTMSDSKKGGDTFKPFLANWLLLFALSALVAFDIYYNYRYIEIFISVPVIIGFISGMIWAILIGKRNHMIPKKANTTCSMSSSKKYQCKLSKDGTLLK